MVIVSVHILFVIYPSFCVIIYGFYLLVNRRLDEWVKLEQLDLDTVETDADEKMEDKVPHHIALISIHVVAFGKITLQDYLIS